jgi:uncharacterized circularly permuted ATP-grasp superfamily protein/uncharacterized alpha-E superfamily protein
MSMPGAEPVTAYAPRPGHRDEMLDDLGAVRPEWRNLHDALLPGGAGRLRHHDTRIQRRLHSDGAAFQIHGEGEQRWRLDPLPVAIASDDWSRLGVALEQRAHVLEAVLADLYGAQRLLGDRLLPAEAVLGHHEYLRPCAGIRPPGGRHLLLYAADVARAPGGAFVVLSDRCEAPSGAGYALENREILARTFPEAARAAGPARLNDWFETLRSTLAAVAPPGVDDPRIVLLTPGPLSHTYFEHSFLARALGYTLVEGADLTMRDGRVWLRSVSGLEPVDVVLRRVNASWCDPLELRAESLLGVPGLAEAARRGTVSIVNPLGTGVAANPALLPYLGALTRAVAGSDPLVETAPSWWCGEPAGRSHVLANLDRLVVRTTERGTGRNAEFGRLLDRARREELRARIEARPHFYVGQEEVDLATAPGLGAHGIEPFHVLQRAFLVASGDGFVTMAGALTRSGSQASEVAIFTGGASKDTWVVEGEVARREPLSLRARRLPQVDLRHSVTSRTAETMCWIGRNLERAETVVRLTQAINGLLDQWPELRDEADGAWWLTLQDALVAVVGEPGAGAGGTLGPGGSDLLRQALVDGRRPASLTTSLRYLLAGSRSVRELLSDDSWRMLSELRDQRSRLDTAEPTDVLDTALAVITPLAALSGLLVESMVRDPGWRFLDSGRRIERSLLLIATLQTTVVAQPVESVEAPVHETLLSTWDSLVAYRRRHRSDVEPEALLALLLTDASNPRSLAYQLDRLDEDLADLPRVDDRAPHATTGVALARDRLAAASAAELAAAGTTGRRDELRALLDDLGRELSGVAEAVEHGYFSHVTTTALLGHRAAR